MSDSENLGKTKCDICGQPAIGSIIQDQTFVQAIPAETVICQECANAILIFFGCIAITSGINNKDIIRLINENVSGKYKSSMLLAIDLVKSTHRKKTSE